MKIIDHEKRIKRRTAIFFIGWTVLIAIFLGWNIFKENQKIIDMASVEARSNLDKDRAFRLWASKKGGLYITVDKNTPPNPYLAHIPERDVVTGSGKKLTLINPATIIREVGNQYAELYGITAKITGKVYLNPVNKPDEWEVRVMDQFIQNPKMDRYVEHVTEDENSYLRMMQPMYMELSCLKCHAITGIKAGELRGATGVRIPLDAYKKIESDSMIILQITSGIVWLFGTGMILFMGFRSLRYEQNRIVNETELKKLSLAVKQSASCVMITDGEGIIQYVNPKFLEVTGYENDEIIGKKPNILKSGETALSIYTEMWQTLKTGNEWHGEYKNRKKNGDLFWSMESISPVKDEAGEVINFIALFEDINERKLSEEMIRRLAFYDPLTDLPNRRSFHDHLEQFAHWTSRTEYKMALLYLDLDRFKSANDTLGHIAGDKLLKIIGERISNALREGDMVFRMGGDEFAVITTNLTKNEDAMLIAEKIISTIREPIFIDGYDLFVTASIGISIYPDDTEDLEELIKNSDLALYHAKEKERNNFQFYSEKMNLTTVEHFQIENDLRKAIEGNQFYLEYQPLIDLRSHSVYGVEALLRWKHPELGLISPEKFISIAEETNMILVIGDWVIQKVCEQMKIWDRENMPHFNVAVNISAVQFRRSDFLEKIKEFILTCEGSRNRLELEITESILMKNPENAGEILKALVEMGVKISIDDFGTGYSSLSYLKQFPVNNLKIDKSFINELASNPDDLAIAKTIVALAREMNLQVVAEGVETESQLEILKQINCDIIQGFYYCNPVSSEKLKVFLSSFPS